MRLNYLVLIGLCVLIGLIVSVQCDDGSQKDATGMRKFFKLPSLLDFTRFKALFKKHYRSFTEEIHRKKIFLARAFETFVSSVRYKYRKATSYLSINYMSDYTRDQLEKMKNTHVLQSLDAADQSRNGKASESIHITPEELEEKLQKLIAKRPDYIKVAEELNVPDDKVVRRKREAYENHNPRQLNLGRLVNTGSDAKLSPGTQAKMVREVEGNNPEFDEPEFISYGFYSDDPQVEDIHYISIDSDVKEMVSQAQNMMNKPDSRAGGLFDPKPVLIDHRESDCFFLPRAQGLCGSCYAFAMVSLVEWLHCMKTGKLVAFSEQFIIDCGGRTNMRGCHGGDAGEVGTFVHNFGVQLRTKYPYRGIEEQCPYMPNTDPKTMGYIRMDLGSTIDIPYNLFNQFLRITPIYVGLATGEEFHFYGGGIDDGSYCVAESNHAVLLIGSGREDGVDYWIFRNSYSVGWGEGGHYRLAKNSNCIPSKRGMTFALNDNFSDLAITPHYNDIHDGEPIKLHYKQHLRDSLSH